jgi:YHS domain-containing protein
MKKVLLGMVVLAAIIMSAVLAYAQDQQTQAPATGTSQEAVNAGNDICPVSGDKVGQGMEKATYEYEGKIYNFCCAVCIGDFKKDPEKYIKKVEEELQAKAEKQAGQ